MSAEAAAPAEAPPEPASPATLHRRTDLARNFRAETRCGLTVVMAKATTDDAKVTCGNCARAAR